MAAALLLAGVAAYAQGPTWDFQDGEDHDWKALNDIEGWGPSKDGLRFHSRGGDPYLESPELDFEATRHDVLTLEMETSVAGTAQIFWKVAGGGWYAEERSVRFRMDEAGKPVTVNLLVGETPGWTGHVTQIRLDPCDAAADVRLISLRLARHIPPNHAEPTIVFPPTNPHFPEEHGAVEGGAYLRRDDQALLFRDCAFFLYMRRAGEWRLQGSGEIGVGSEFDRNESEAPTAEWRVQDGQVRGDMCLGPARVEIAPSTKTGAFTVRLTMHASGPVSLRRLSVVRYRPGNGSFGAKHRGALLPGLEYLGPGETSSSTLDDEGPGHERWAPDRMKVCAPCMAVAGDGATTGIAWEVTEPASPVFDVPDRREGMDCALLGLMYPPVPDWMTENRERSPVPVSAGEWDGREFVFRVFAREGEDVAAAVGEQTFHLDPLSSPSAPRDAKRQAGLSLGTFLDSGLYDANAHGWGHCMEANWARTPAADVCYLLDLYADGASAEEAERLRARAHEVLEHVPPEQRLLQGISHVRPEGITLRLGGTLEALRGLKAAADVDLAEMREDGSWKYEGKYARGHFEDTALGICAPRVIRMLRYVRLSGSARHLEAARRALARLDKFDLPRGAQTWEVPLHTPDILAAAQAVEAFVLAYELTDENAFVESAERWAWTGVPFVYLWGEPGLGTMPCATIPVFGATNWQAPSWFGTPVQWCGLVYAWSLYRLAPCGARGPWKQLADGITIAGMQMQYPDGALAGCLPDVFYLRAQQRAGPSINPAALLLLAKYLEGQNPDLAQTRVGSLRIVHLPGLAEAKLDVGKLTFTLPGGSPAQEVVVPNALLQPAEGSKAAVQDHWDGGSACTIISLPGPGRYEFALVH